MGLNRAHVVSDSAPISRDRAYGVRLIAGVDEVGRACWAGPIMAAGVLFDLERLGTSADCGFLEELNDSKRLSRAKRERLARVVLAHAESVSIVSLAASEIDRGGGVDRANAACLERALQAVGGRAQLRLVDGKRPLGAEALPHTLIVRGDAMSATVAAASIVAKVARDDVMVQMGEAYPGYGFERHKGYGTAEHAAAVVKLGPSPIHRMSVNARCYAEFDARGRE